MEAVAGEDHITETDKPRDKGEGVHPGEGDQVIQGPIQDLEVAEEVGDEDSTIGSSPSP